MKFVSASFLRFILDPKWLQWPSRMLKQFTCTLVFGNDRI